MPFSIFQDSFCFLIHFHSSKSFLHSALSSFFVGAVLYSSYHCSLQPNAEPEYLSQNPDGFLVDSPHIKHLFAILCFFSLLFLSNDALLNSIAREMSSSFF